MKEFLNRLSGQQENRFDLQETTNPQMESVLQELDALEASGNFGAYQLDADAATALATEMLGISLEQYQLIQAEAQAIATNGSSIKEQVASLLTVLNKKDVLPRLSPATSVLVMLLLTTTLIACTSRTSSAQTESQEPTPVATTAPDTTSNEDSVDDRVAFTFDKNSESTTTNVESVDSKTQEQEPAKGYRLILESRMNVRSGPSATSEIVGSADSDSNFNLLPGTEVVIDGKSVILTDATYQDLQAGLKDGTVKEVWVNVGTEDLGTKMGPRYIAVRFSEFNLATLKQFDLVPVTEAENNSEVVQQEAEENIGGPRLTLTERTALRDELVRDGVFDSKLSVRVTQNTETGLITVVNGADVYTFKIQDAEPILVDDKGDTIATYDEKSETWLKAAVESLGGENYLSIDQVKKFLSVEQFGYLENYIKNSKSINVSTGLSEIVVEIEDSRAFLNSALYEIEQSSGEVTKVTIVDPETETRLFSWRAGHGIRVVNIDLGDIVVSADTSIYGQGEITSIPADGSQVSEQTMRRLKGGRVNRVLDFGRVGLMSDDVYTTQLTDDTRKLYTDPASLQWYLDVGGKIDDLGSSNHNGETMLRTISNRFMNRWNNLAGSDNQISSIKFEMAVYPEDEKYYNDDIVSSLPANYAEIDNGVLTITVLSSNTKENTTVKGSIAGFSYSEKFAGALKRLLFDEFGDSSEIEIRDGEIFDKSAKPIQGNSVDQNGAMTPIFYMVDADGSIHN